MFSGKKVLVVAIAVFLSLGVIVAESYAATPRNETLIVDILTGKNANPKNFNMWAAWRGNDKGLQQLIADPLWIVEYATGEIISVLASELPVYNEDFTQMTVKLREGVAWSVGDFYLRETGEVNKIHVQIIKDSLCYRSSHLKTRRSKFGKIRHGFIPSIVKYEIETNRIMLGLPGTEPGSHERFGATS